MKFAILTLAFYGNATLERMLKNTGGMVDAIYLSHSPVPWSKYNPDARHKYTSDFNPEKVSSLPYAEKIKFLTGVWETDEAQREDALQQARKDGIDYLIVQDSDEFYLKEEFLKNLEGIRKNPDHPVYVCPWVKFWKNTQYVMQARIHDGQYHQTVTTCPNFAVNVNYPGIHFSLSRLVNENHRPFMLEGLCLHLCWVLTNEQVLKKISTWGHSHQFDHLKWFKHKWLSWTPQTKHIGLFKRSDYYQAVPFNGVLPEELHGFELEPQPSEKLGFLASIDSWRLDMLSLLKINLVELRQKFFN